MKQAQQMQAQMLEAQEKLKDEVVEASAGGGMVKVKMGGDLTLREIAAQLERLHERTPRGGTKWSPSSVKNLIDRARRSGLINFNTAAGLSLNVPAATFNAPRSLHQGVEAAMTLALARDLTGIGDTLAVTQIWTHNDFRFVRDATYGDNRIAGIPDDVLRTVMSYAHPSGFFIAPAVDWVPRGPFADHANTLRVPGYALFGIQTGWEFRNGVSLFVDARNLTDARYVSDVGVVANARAVAGGAATLAAFYPGNGRSVFAGIRASF